MNIIRLSWKNIIHTPFNTALNILLMTLGVGIISLLLLVHKEVENKLYKNLRGIDMVVGAKGSPLQLILSSVYHIDNPTGNISLSEANTLSKNRLIERTIPMSFGDSFKGHKILGTNSDYLSLYNTNIYQGRLWEKPLEVVVGNEVARLTNLEIGDVFFGSHGLVDGGEIHDNHAYQVVGVLNQSGSVLDNLIITSLESVWKVHDTHNHCEHDHEEGHSSMREHDHEEKHECHHDHHKDDSCEKEHNHEKTHVCEHDHEEDQSLEGEHDHEEKQDDDRKITSLLVEFKNPMGIVQLPRMINEKTNMQAALPTFEIDRLTSLLGVGVQTINVIALIIILISGLSIFISLYNSLKTRRPELALMRVHGASKLQLLKLVLKEGLIVTVFGTILGLITSRLVLLLLPMFIEEKFLYSSSLNVILVEELWLFILTLFIGALASFIPAMQSYKTDIPKTLMNE